MRAATEGFALWTPTAFEKAGETFDFGGFALERVCPHCKKPIHAGASFCPHCASSINSRKAVTPPRTVPLRALLAGLCAALCLALALSVWACTRPKTVSGFGEVIYTDSDGSYRIYLSQPGMANLSAAETLDSPELNREYGYYIRLCASHTGSDSSATRTFREKISGINLSVDTPHRGLKISCGDVSSYASDSVHIIKFSYSVSQKEDYDAVLTLTLRMENGDTINLSQRKRFHTVSTYTFTPEQAPMGTCAELQAFLDSLSGAAEPDAVINVLLPAVTYSQPIRVSARSVNLIGDTDGGGRPVFSGGLSLSADSGTSNFTGIDFTGSGGTGISARGTLHLNACTLTGWDTGVASGGSAWVTLSSCVLEDNGIALHLSADGYSAAASAPYFDSTFRNNGTAVLLERLPSGNQLDFTGSVFFGNVTDIDNRCGQSINITDAIFR